MNSDQVLSAVRSIVAFLAGLAVAKGWIGADQVTTITAAAVALVPVIWGIYSHSKANKIASVTALPEVQAVVTTSQKQADAGGPKVVTPSDIATGNAPNPGTANLY